MTELDLVMIGRFIADACSAFGWSQRELGRRSGVPQTAISRFLRGRSDALDLEQLARIATATGARLRVVIEAPFLADRARQRDFVHAGCVGYVARRLRAAGWRVETEVEIVSRRGPGWIDILAFHPGSAMLLVIEIKTQLDDLGQIQRTLSWYEHEAWAAARRRGWLPTAMTGALIVLATRAVDQRLRDNRAAARLGFPVAANVARALIADPATAALPGRVLARIDPLTRASRWLQATVLEPNVAPSPHVDYADVARKLRTRGARRESSGLELGVHHAGPRASETL